MKLLVVESPAKARTVSKYLDDKYTVKSSVGHVRDLPKSKKDAVDIEAGFVPQYQIVPGKEKVVSELKTLCKRADEVVLATDPDREGEAIAWHVAEICDLGTKQKARNKKPLKRIVFHEITKEAISEAMKHPREIDLNLKTAQEARRVLDRLFGYDLSALIWKKVRYGLSAGRVQSPALRILAEREREIEMFEPEDYWVITARTKTPRNEDLVLTASEEPRDEAEVNRILSVGKSGTWSISTVKESEMRRGARPPFITSTLQQTASTRYGFAPSKTMALAQRLYEAGHITYMRTDSTTLAASAQKEIVSEIKKTNGSNYVAPRQYKTKSKVAQEAHEAIRPTNVTKKEAGTTTDQKQLYALIRARTIASQMSDARIKRVKITAQVTPPAGTEQIPDFTANGARTVFDGWLAADPAARGEDVELAEVAEGDKLSLSDIASEQKQTEPPKHYTEAGLIKELEKRGIGRPSTYAAIMKTLGDRGYVVREGRTLIPTDTGKVVSAFLEKNFEKYISDTFTAEMENELDEIASGKRGYEKTLADFYKPFTKTIGKKEDIPKLTDLGPAPKEFTCPECNASMVYKLGKSGTFLSCSRFPDCTGARTTDGEKMGVIKETGETCPECGGDLIERQGRFGVFVGCGNYPKCKYIKQDASDARQATTGVKCPECKEGELAERRGKFGPFYGCNNYPKCRFTMKSKPTGDTCSKCGSLIMEGTKTIPNRCSNKECPNHNPHKKEKARHDG